MSSTIDIGRYLTALDRASPVKVTGRVNEIVGLVVKAAVPEVWIGEMCEIYPARSKVPVKSEVVGFKDGQVLLMPLGELMNVSPQSEVVPTGKPLVIKAGWGLMGRVLDGIGQPIDTEFKGPLECDEEWPVTARAPDPMKRMRVTQSISIGIRAIDGILTCGEGQRIGIFAAAGMGKSTLLGMIARNTEAEVNVITLVGERGREVKDFLEKDLGPEGLKRSVIVCATSDQPSLVRLKAAYVGTAIAEYFRDKGKKVMLMMDSVTRFARAQREIGLACGEPPARQGYTPSVFSELPRLLERAGNNDKGSITAFYTVLRDSDTAADPVDEEVRSILDGHIYLSAALAERNHYPAIDVNKSKSRVMMEVLKHDKEHLAAAGQLVAKRAVLIEKQDIIAMARDEALKDPKTADALKYEDPINSYLKQGTHDKVDFETSSAQLKKIFK